jgi:PPOX class probable F420-dependent enzyme
MGIALADNVKQLLDRPNFAHLATLMEDGSPLSTPVWVGREGDRIIVCTSGKSLKARNTQRDPRVAISMVDFQDPYRELQLRGRVVEHRPDPQVETAGRNLDAIRGQAVPDAYLRRSCGSDYRSRQGALYETSL